MSSPATVLGAFLTSFPPVLRETYAFFTYMIPLYDVGFRFLRVACRTLKIALSLSSAAASESKKDIKVKKSKNEPKPTRNEETSDQEKDLKPISKAGSRPWSRKDKKVKKRTKV
ncbi:hypothetical protein Tco_1001538 [Tanacetum coccineum]